jgi:hypothetical protein
MSTFNNLGEKAFIVSANSVSKAASSAGPVNLSGIARGTRVKLDLSIDPTGGTVIPAQLSDGANFIGWATEDVSLLNLSPVLNTDSPGPVVNVRLKNCPGTFFATVSGAIAAGTEVLADNLGQMRAGSSGAGTTLDLITYEASAESGDIVEIGPGGAASL